MESSLSSESTCWGVLGISGEDDRDFLDAILLGLAELDFDLLLFVEETLLRFVERLALDVSLLTLAADWLDTIEPAGEAERADPADSTLEALLPGDGDRELTGDFEGLLGGDADPDWLLERDLEAGDAGSDPEGVWATIGEADLDDWLLLTADDELDADSESLASK